MGEGRNDALRVNFDRKLKLEFHASVSHQRRRIVSIQRDGRCVSDIAALQAYIEAL